MWPKPAEVIGRRECEQCRCSVGHANCPWERPWNQKPTQTDAKFNKPLGQEKTPARRMTFIANTATDAKIINPGKMAKHFLKTLDPFPNSRSSALTQRFTEETTLTIAFASD